MPRKSKYLHDFTRTQNQRTITRLRQIMDEYGLSQAEVARLLDVSKVLVSYWFTHQRQCPENTPEMLRAIVVIMKRPSSMKRCK
jgi:DNA-binding transcriptional regulator YiaG